MDDANADSVAPEGDAAPARTPSHAPLRGLLLAVSAPAAAEPADAADGAHPERAVSGTSTDGLGTRRSIRKRPTSVRSEGRTEPASAAADAWPVAALGEKWDVAQAPPRLNPCGDLARGKLPDVHPPRRGPSAAAAAQQNDTSAFIGVRWATRESQWVVQVNHGGRKHYVGLFDDEREAARAFDGAARRLRPRGLAHGGRAGYQWKRVNFPTAAEQAFAEGEGMPDKKCKAQAALTLEGTKHGGGGRRRSERDDCDAWGNSLAAVFGDLLELVAHGVDGSAATGPAAVTREARGRWLRALRNGDTVRTIRSQQQALAQIKRQRGHRSSAPRHSQTQVAVATVFGWYPGTSQLRLRFAQEGGAAEREESLDIDTLDAPTKQGVCVQPLCSEGAAALSVLSSASSQKWKNVQFTSFCETFH
jgi:hypothetical protein